MEDYNDQLDLLDDDGDGVVEMSLMEEEQKSKKSGNRNSIGCAVIFFLIISSVITAGWFATQMML